jgi:hypothetical protein
MEFEFHELDRAILHHRAARLCRRLFSYFSRFHNLLISWKAASFQMIRAGRPPQHPAGFEKRVVALVAKPRLEVGTFVVVLELKQLKRGRADAVVIQQIQRLRRVSPFRDVGQVIGNSCIFVDDFEALANFLQQGLVSDCWTQ